MARIPLAIASRGLDVGSVVSYPSGSPIGAAVEGFGNTMQSAGNRLGAQQDVLAERAKQLQEQKDAFTATVKTNEFGAELDALDTVAVQNAPADGSGLHDSVYGQLDPVTGAAVKPGSFDKIFDQYATKIPEGKAREEFLAKKELFRKQGSLKLASAQYQREQQYYDVEIQKVQGQLLNSISQLDPSDRASFKAFKEQGAELIQKSGLDALKKDVAIANLNAATEEAFLQTQSPAEVRKLLGMPDPVKRATAAAAGGGAASSVLAAIEAVESSGNSNAVSGKGATGLMQVMPATAREIAGEIGDGQFPADGSNAEVARYLMDPEVSRTYGKHYFNKMLTRYDGDVDAALVAYNGGAKRADAWIAAGKDDSVIPRESAAYYKKVRAKMGGGAAGAADAAVSSGPDLPIITKSASQTGRVSDPDVAGIQPRVVGRFKAFQNAFGSSVPVVSGFRDPARNAKAGGAKSSQHMHGSAIDLDVSGMSKEERVRLIQTARANGFAGIGVYENSIHIDVGPKRAWGPSHHSNSIPDWAKAAVDTPVGQPVAGGSWGTVVSAPDPDFANIPFERRRVLANQADVAIGELQRAEAATQTANYTAYRDAIELSVVQGGIKDESLISDDTLLKDSDKATLLRSVQAANKENAGVDALISTVTGGAAVSINPFDAEQTKLNDKAFEVFTRSAPAEQSDTAAAAWIGATKIVPKKVQAELAQGAAAMNAPELAAALSRANTIQQAAPVSFDNFDGGKEVRDKLTMFRTMVNDRGMDAVQAAKRILDLTSPEKKASQAVLKESATKFTKKLTLGQITDAFDPSIFRAEPGAGLLPQQQNVLMQEFREIAEDRFYEVGDEDAARALAIQDIKKVWGPTTVSGKPQLMRLPPENHYPPGMQGSHDYLRADAVKTAQAYVADQFENRVVDNVAIVADARTIADVEAKRPPRYRLFYTYEQDGQTMADEVLAGPWGMTPEHLKGALEEEQSRLGAMHRDEAERAGAANDVLRQGEVDAERALTETVGPDWMKARAAEAARERANQDAGAIRLAPPPSETVKSKLDQSRQELFETAPELETSFGSAM